MERLTILVSGPVVQLADLPEKLHLTTGEDSEAAASPQVMTSFRTMAAKAPLPIQGSDLELGETGVDLNELVATMERNMIMKALEKAGGVRSKAAQFLGLNRTTLLEKMKKMKIEMQKQ